MEGESCQIIVQFESLHRILDISFFKLSSVGFFSSVEVFGNSLSFSDLGFSGSNTSVVRKSIVVS